MDGGSLPTLVPARGRGRRLLVAAADRDVVELLASTLEPAGYRAGAAAAGAEVARRLAERRYALVVLDAELPGLDELAQGGRLEPAYRPPVLLPAARESLAGLVPALGAGERDCVTKPVRIAEVLARVKVLLRDGGGRRGGTLDHADLVLDDGTCRARRGARALDLRPADYRLLRHLLVSPGKVLSKEQIGRYVWGGFRGDNAVEQLASRLRRKVDRDGPALIHTRRGFGY
ncbi:MAG: response regulator transcription factor [Streptomyces sp.]|uniref:response regulator transcription factor n=1 Tax=Streptomyces sp. TaxID=1931 RepID=UPI0026001B51|nr:response regulator transcription factor [Streptomyces sp.]MBW8797756.1 response regulator transcription factor [Streptomyces sp.]